MALGKCDAGRDQGFREIDHLDFIMASRPALGREAEHVSEDRRGHGEDGFVDAEEHRLLVFGPQD